VLHDCIDNENVHFLVAVLDKEVAGFVIVNLNKSLRKALVENIFVKADLRGQGIGSLLIKHVVETARSDGYDFISALIPPDDIAALQTYQKAGFSQGETFLWGDI
jgi:phosphinothricin acetyltransferase